VYGSARCVTWMYSVSPTAILPSDFDFGVNFNLDGKRNQLDTPEALTRSCGT
jgi:hypothetical protein